MKVELVSLAPDGTERERQVWETDSGRIIALTTRPGASDAERRAAAESLMSTIGPDDLAIYQVPADGG